VAFVLNDDATVSQRAVTLDRQTGELAVVASGLKPGERVITDGTLQLKDGSKVELRQTLIPPSPPAREGRGRRGEGAGQGQPNAGGATAPQNGGSRP
jgi:hypothetical protein